MVSADLDQVISCNCTHCAIKSLLLVFVPTEDFRTLSGEESLSEYRFNQKVIAHFFCSTCGVEPYAFGKDKMGNSLVAINVRTLDGVDISELKTAPFDGLHLL
jgi:hypothetical protein